MTEQTAIVGLTRELKSTRALVRELKAQNLRWWTVAQTLRKLAGLDENKFKNLLQLMSEEYGDIAAPSSKCTTQPLFIRWARTM